MVIVQVIIAVICGAFINLIKEHCMLDDSFTGHIEWLILLCLRIVFWVLIGILTCKVLFGLILPIFGVLVTFLF
jgi:uncharacterized membrane protein